MDPWIPHVPSAGAADAAPATARRFRSPASLAWVEEELERLDRADLRRRLPPPLLRQAARWETADGWLVNLASNDYLGLAGDPRLAEAAADAARREGVGRGASPLICGRSASGALLEQRLAEFEQTEAALLFPSGFAANAGVVPALAEEGDAIYADAKNHASLIDGCRLSRARKFVYPHRDMGALEHLLAEGGEWRRRLIVTDTVFSMDGDVAPIPELAALAARYEAMLLVDEAHATGVLGPGGRGAVEQFASEAPPGTPPLGDQIAVRIGTLSKALGTSGGFVCGSQALIEWLANRARTCLFSTAPSAVVAAAGLAALEIAAGEPHRRRRLAELSRRVHAAAVATGWTLPDSATHIVPLRVGGPADALRLASRLRERGFWAPPIRPPSVPAGESLVRLSLRADLEEGDVDRLREALAEHGPSCGSPASRGSAWRDWGELA